MKYYNKFIWLFAVFLWLAPLAGQAAAVPAGLSLNYDSQAFTAAATVNIATSSIAVQLPWQWQALVPAYDYSFSTTGLYDPSRPLAITIN
jgi:hypothetical protein